MIYLSVNFSKERSECSAVSWKGNLFFLGGFLPARGELAPGLTSSYVKGTHRGHTGSKLGLQVRVKTCYFQASVAMERRATQFEKCYRNSCRSNFLSFLVSLKGRANIYDLGLVHFASIPKKDKRSC